MQAAGIAVPPVRSGGALTVGDALPLAAEGYRSTAGGLTPPSRALSIRSRSEAPSLVRTFRMNHLSLAEISGQSEIVNHFDSGARWCRFAIHATLAASRNGTGAYPRSDVLS